MPDDQLGELLKQGDFDGLFRTRMGWDNPQQRVPAPVDDCSLLPVAVADKRGVTAWRVDCPEGLPKSSEQHRVVRTLKRLSRDQLVVFVSSDAHLWLWPEQRPSGVGYRLVRHEYPVEKPSESLLQRLGKATFKLAEEEGLTSSEVLTRVRLSFNADKVTKTFYGEFQTHHKKFASEVEGIEDGHSRRWYASVLLNRLMFVYFIQQKSFLDGDSDYLSNRLQMVREHYGADQFYAFFKEFLLPLFHQGLGSNKPEYADPEMGRIVGSVPYVNGGIFEPHPLEETHDIQIKDKAFESLFAFFDKWRWHLDENPTGADNEINPDILGFIFEQYVNKKQQGAYYTKQDVTGYMATSAIIPAVVDRLIEAGLDDPCGLLPNSGDDYLHDAMSYGADKEMPRQDMPQSEFPEGSLDIALPGERWCDVTHRRERHAEVRKRVNSGGVGDINEAVTQNLDLAALMADYLLTLNDADECQRVFEVLRSLTVCDPTVGSGAFLLAALDVLDPLYTAVFNRAEEIAAGGGLEAPFLQQARSHPIRRYWLLKTLCLNNLYGVDLMAEATEIAKLRLFLKLAAQLDDASSIEPLPDLDFNIKSGNLLVGIADAEDIKRRFSDRGVLPFGLDEMEDAVESTAAAYEEFVGIQDSTDDQAALGRAKSLLGTRIGQVTDQADRGLHEMRGDVAPLKTWKETHSPFHWFAEFPTVWRNGGFDVIIGNPPYIGLKGKRRDQFDYKWIGYETSECPDIYAVCMERASSLLNNKGRFAMIVMHSLCYSVDFECLRNNLNQQFSILWVSSYSRASDSLFSGSAKVRNSIAISSKGSQPRIYTTRCHRWLAPSRPYLFSLLEYSKPSQALFKCGGVNKWPFIDGGNVVDAFTSLAETCAPIVSANNKIQQPFQLGIKKVASVQTLGAFVTEPPIVDPISRQPVTTNSSKPSWFSFLDERSRDLALLCLSGRWGYLWWLMFGDEFHVTRSVLSALPCDVEHLAASHHPPCDVEFVSLVDRMLELSTALQDEMVKYVEFHLRGSGNKRMLVGRYMMWKLRHITDEADWLLAQAWGLSREQYEAAGNLRDRMTFGQKDD